jgi:hypothetical protein
VAIVADKRHAPAYADQAVMASDSDTASSAMALLAIVCRRSGVEPRLLVAEAERRAAARSRPYA